MDGRFGNWEGKTIECYFPCDEEENKHLSNRQTSDREQQSMSTMSFVKYQI